MKHIIIIYLQIQIGWMSWVALKPSSHLPRKIIRFLFSPTHVQHFAGCSRYHNILVPHCSMLKFTQLSKNVLIQKRNLS